MSDLIPLISPQAHRRFDQFAFPALLIAAAAVARRDRRAGALVLMMAAGEGTAQVTTDYPPPVGLGWMSFRDHNRVAALHGLFGAALALFTPRLAIRHRGLLLGMAAVPIVLAVLSDTRDERLGED